MSKIAPLALDKFYVSEAFTKPDSDPQPSKARLVISKSQISSTSKSPAKSGIPQAFISTDQINSKMTVMHIDSSASAGKSDKSDKAKLEEEK